MRQEPEFLSLSVFRSMYGCIYPEWLSITLLLSVYQKEKPKNSKFYADRSDMTSFSIFPISPGT